MKDFKKITQKLNKSPLKGASQMQDQLALNLIGESGTFLDIGSCHPVSNNNSFLLEQSGWIGLMFEIIPELVTESSKQRTNPAFCVDVTSDKFIKILNENITDKKLDFISLDVDEASLKCLKSIIDSGYSFKCMTFEHDFHKRNKLNPDSKYFNSGNEEENNTGNLGFGEGKVGISLRDESRIFLHKHGYKMLFSNVNNNPGKYSSWEDWWIDPKEFPKSIFDYSEDNIHYTNCMNNVKKFIKKENE